MELSRFYLCFLFSLILGRLGISLITRSYYRKENAADMYMQDVLQPIHCMFLHQLPCTIVSHISSYRKCTIKYKLGGHMCISVEHVLWVNFKLKVVQAAIIIYYS